MSDQVLPAVLGWSNGSDGQVGGENLQLYALDDGPSPRWANKPHGRTVEHALRVHGLGAEGDRFLLVHLGNRFVTDERVAQLTEQIAALLDDADGQGPLAAASRDLVHHVARMLDRWADMGAEDPEARNRELWSPLHVKADVVRALLPGEEPHHG